jgi:uncharacterized membrane-anchored protein
VGHHVLKMQSRFIQKIFSILLCLFSIVAQAQSESSSPPEREDEISRAYSAANAAAQKGPANIPLGAQATLKLPAGFAYIPIPEGRAVMTAMGNRTDDSFLGIVIAEKMSGFVVMEFKEAGYIKDDDAKGWNAGELLKNLKEGTEAANEERRQRHIPEFEVVGWIEPPAYEAATHRLVWSAATQNKKPVANDVQGVNYNTYLLGREGYLELNLVSDRNDIEAEKPLARELLNSVAFKEGKQYSDFDSGTDKVAGYGLAALIGGVAIKKLGLLATMGLFLAKAWKLVAVGAFGIAAGARKFFGRKKDGEVG